MSIEVHQVAETVTTSNELDLLFGPLFDEYFNGENQIVLKSSAVTTTDASNKRQQQPDSTSSTSTLTTTVTATGNFDLRSKAGTVTPFANPERQFRARREVSPAPIHNIYTFYESESSESDTENVDIESLTLEQYVALDQNNTRRRFTCPDDSTFEIKGQLLRELRKIPFSGGPTDSAVEHISNVLEIASIFNA
ncbi:hypothetical protein Tco_0654373 [Tanacetum coccineum]|uniref:Uncharacterized protein n=1 Tax=Tanacetum coccineum TaxID=301880 RepID=A0ABQ4X369_9ASTR